MFLVISGYQAVFLSLQDENQTLVERLIKYKAKDADKMNEENDNFVK